MNAAAEGRSSFQGRLSPAAVVRLPVHPAPPSGVDAGAPPPRTRRDRGSLRLLQAMAKAISWRRTISTGPL